MVNVVSVWIDFIVEFPQKYTFVFTPAKMKLTDVDSLCMVVMYFFNITTAVVFPRFHFPNVRDVCSLRGGLKLVTASDSFPALVKLSI